jgi:hypothetical protein
VKEVSLNNRPTGDTDMADSTDQIYMSGAQAAGKSYMAGIL